MDTGIEPEKTHHQVLLLLLVVAFIALLGYMSYAGIFKSIKDRGAQQQIPKTVTAQQAQVSITKNGFSPSTITIKKGGMVTWTNTDKKPHRVASDPHPTHTNLPGFDSQDNLGTDESFTYTFEKAGTFTYHDHLSPLKLRGTVLVVE